MEKIVISLKCASKRREHIHQQFHGNDLSYSFFDAISPDTAQKQAQVLGIKYDTQGLTENELACLISHASLWDKIVTDKIPYMAIFEDDVYLGEDAGYYLNKTQWINPDWHIIKLEAFSDNVFLDKKAHILDKGNRVISQLTGKNLGAAGYILSEKGAYFLLDYIRRNLVLEPLDHIVFDRCTKLNEIKIYQMNPALCIQSFIYDGSHANFPSALEGERYLKRRSESKKRSIIQKIKRELSRAWRKIMNRIFSKKVSFK